MSTSISNTDIASSILNESEFKDLNRHEKAAKSLYACINIKTTASLLNISAGSVVRARRAFKQNRDIGKNGRPHLLNEKEETELIDWYKFQNEIGNKPSISQLTSQAKYIYSKSRPLLMDDKIPKFSRHFLSNLFERHNLRLTKERSNTL